MLVRGGFYGKGKTGDANRIRLRDAAAKALETASCRMLPMYADPALNERCYGDLQVSLCAERSLKVRLYIICLPEDGLHMIEESVALQGLNKTAAVAEFGEETVTKWRRSYDTRPPNGESLQVRD